MELVRIFKEHNVFGWVSVGTAILVPVRLKLGHFKRHDLHIRIRCFLLRWPPFRSELSSCS